MKSTNARNCDHLVKTFELEDIWLEKFDENDNIDWKTTSACAGLDHTSDRVYDKIEWHDFTYHHIKCIFRPKPEPKPGA